MTPVDEARGVAELVAFSSGEEVAEELCRSKQWVSKRACVAKAPEYVLAFAETAAIEDLEAIYELARFAEENPEGAQQLIAAYEPGSNLRKQLKVARRPTRTHVTEGLDAGPRGPAEVSQDLNHRDENGADDGDASSRSALTFEGVEDRERDLSCVFRSIRAVVPA